MLLQAASLDINLLSELLKQSPLIVALLVAIKYGFSKISQLEAQSKEQQGKIENYITEDRKTLLIALENNTRVMQENIAFNQHVIKELEDLKK